MSLKPILFSGPMVRAILSGSKTQTRRVVKPQPVQKNGNTIVVEGCQLKDYSRGAGQIWELNQKWKRRFRPGDILWVRETVATCFSNNPINDLVHYYATEGELTLDLRHDAGLMKKRPSIHMPFRACRLFLRVTGSHFERLQGISDTAALDEGMLHYDDWQTPEYKTAVAEAKKAGKKPPLGFSMRERFIQLWDKLNAKRGYGWETDPWVEVVAFEVIDKATALALAGKEKP